MVGRLRPVPLQPRGTPPVAGSRPSKDDEVIALSTATASATVRPNGPALSWVWEIGITPARLTRPIVGLMPTTPQLFAGPTMLPSVSEPIATAVKFAATAAPEPELEPDALQSMMYGLWQRPPRPDQPLVEAKPRKFAHSLRPALPRITAPAWRSFSATVESCVGAGIPTSA